MYNTGFKRKTNRAKQTRKLEKRTQIKVGNKYN